MVKSLVNVLSSSSNLSTFPFPVSSLSSSETTAILFSLNVLYNSSKASASKSRPFKALANSSKVISPFSFPFFTSSYTTRLVMTYDC